MICRSCQLRRANRPRGLCWTCYYTDGARERYPSTSKFGRRGAGIANRGQRLPVPTSALPGSPEKVAVLEERVARGEMLFHPADARVDGLRETREARRAFGGVGPRRDYSKAA